MSETLRDRRVRHARSIIMPQPTSTALLGESGDLAGLRVLVLGNAVSETMCALMHTECRRAETRLPGCQTEARSTDLVLVPHLTRENVDRVISQATHALCHHGRVVVALPGHGRDLIAHCAMMLIGAGFDLPTLRGEAEQRTLCAVRGEHPNQA
jgi:hypothetical protein